MGWHEAGTNHKSGTAKNAGYHYAQCPGVTIIDSKAKKERELEWIDRMEEFDAFMNP